MNDICDIDSDKLFCNLVYFTGFIYILYILRTKKETNPL